MLPFMKTMMSFAVGLLASSAVVFPASAACEQAQWLNGTTNCEVTGEVVLGINRGAQDWSQTLWFDDLINYAPTGTGIKEIDGGIVYYNDGATGNYYFQDYVSGREAHGVQIFMGASGALINTGGVLDPLQGNYMLLNGNTVISGGVFGKDESGNTQYVRILNGIPENMLTDSERAAGDMVSAGNITVGGGTFFMKTGEKTDGCTVSSGSCIGFLTASQEVFTDAGWRTFHRGGTGSLYIKGGEFNIVNGGTDNKYVILGTSKVIATGLASATYIYGGRFNIAEKTVLEINGNEIFVSLNPAGSDHPYFFGSGTLRIGSNSGHDAISVTSGLTSLDDSFTVKRVAFSGNVNLQTDEYFRELELYSGIFTFDKTVNVREYLLQESNAMINAPTGVLEIQDGVTAAFNGTVVLDTLAVYDNAFASLTKYQDAGDPKTITIKNLLVRNGTVNVFSNIATLSNVTLEGTGRLNLFDTLNLYNLNFDPNGTSILNMASKVETGGSENTYNPTVLLQSGTMVLNGENLTAYNLEQIVDPLDPAKTSFQVKEKGKGSIVLTGNAGVTVNGNVFGRGTYFGNETDDSYEISLRAQYGTVTLNAAENYLSDVNISYRDASGQETAGKTGGLVLNGALTSIDNLSVDFGGFTTINAGANLEIQKSLETEINSNISGSGTLSLTAGSTADVAGGIHIGKVVLEEGTSAAATDKAVATFKKSVHIGTLKLGSYSEFKLEDYDNYIGSIVYAGANATLWISKGETVMDTSDVLTPTGSGNSIQIAEDAVLAITNNFNPASVPVEIYGRGTLRLVGNAMATLGTTGADSKLLYGLEIGSGTATISNNGATGSEYYSLGRLTFTNEGAGTLSLNGKLLLTDNLTTKNGTTISAENGIIQLFCKTGEFCYGTQPVKTGYANLGGNANIKTLALWEGYLSVSGTTNLQNLTFEDNVFDTYVEIADGGVLNLTSMTTNTANKVFKGEGTLNSVEGGNIKFQTGTNTLKNLNVDGTVDLIGSAKVDNTVVKGTLNLFANQYLVQTGGVFTLENAAVLNVGTGLGLYVQGTANINNAVVGDDDTVRVTADSGVLNYNYDDAGVDTEFVLLKNSGVLNVNNNVQINLESASVTGNNNVLNVIAGKTADVIFSTNEPEQLTLTGAGKIETETPELTLKGSSLLTDLAQFKGKNLTLANTLSHNVKQMEVLNLTVDTNATLDVYENLNVTTSLSGDGLLRAKSGASFSLKQSDLGTLEIEKNASVTTGNGTQSFDYLNNAGTFNLVNASVGTLNSSGNINGTALSLTRASATSTVSGSTTLGTLNVDANHTADLTGYLDITNLSVTGVANVNGDLTTTNLTVNGGGMANLNGALNVNTLNLETGGKANVYSDTTFNAITGHEDGSGETVLNLSSNVNVNSIDSISVEGTGTLNLTQAGATSLFAVDNELNVLNVGANHTLQTGSLVTVGTIKTGNFDADSKLEVKEDIVFNRLNLDDSADVFVETDKTLSITDDFYLKSGVDATGNGTLALNGSQNVIDKTGTVFSGILALGENTTTTFTQSADLTNLTVKEGSFIKLDQETLKIKGEYKFDFSDASAPSSVISLTFRGTGSDSGVLDVENASLATGSVGSLKFDVDVDYDALIEGAGEIKAVTGKNKDFFAGVDLPSGQNLRYQWDVRASCSDGGTGVCYDLSVIKTAEQVAQDFGGAQNETDTAKAVLDDGLFEKTMSETYELAAHLHTLSQKKGTDFVKALNAMAPDVSGVRTWQANALQNKVSNTINTRLSALAPALKKAPAPVNWRARRGISGGSPYETRWMNRSQYRKAVGYDDGAVEQGRSSGTRKVRSSDYFRSTRDNDFDAENVRGTTRRNVPASDYYRSSYEPVQEKDSGGYDTVYTKRYKKPKGRTVQDVDFGLWAQAFYATSKLSGDAGFSGDSTGFALGFDAAVTENFVLGLGYSNTSSDADAEQHELTTTNDSFFLYGMYKPGNWYFNGVLTYGNSDTEEKADFTGGLQKEYNYGGSFVSAQLMAGLQNQSAVSPAFGARFTTLSTDSYVRSGQKVSGFTSNTLTLIAEGRVGQDYVNEENDSVFRPEGRLALTYDVMNDSEEATVLLPNNVTYQVKGEELDKLAVEAGLSASYNVSNRFEISGGWDGEFRSGYHNNTFSIKARFNF